MNQPVPEVTPADVDRILEREFPASADRARALLQQYGKAEWQREIDRVRLACLKLANRDLQKLEEAVRTACLDYRDVLSAAEYPAYLRTDPTPSRDVVKKQTAIQSDWEQYQHWRNTGSSLRDRSPGERKKQLRQLVRQAIESLTPEQQQILSVGACEMLLGRDIYAKSTSVLLYMPLRGEVDVRLIFERAISDGKCVALPRYIPETAAYSAFFVGDQPLVPGPFNILEPASANPAPLNRLDLIVAPGLAFDPRGRRLGRGKGFYDRLLSEASGLKCGICFEEQLLAEIPVEPHDVTLDFIATPARWLDCRGPTQPRI